MLLDENAVEGSLANYLVVHLRVEILIEGDGLQSRLPENVASLDRYIAALDIDVDTVQVVRPEPYHQVGECLYCQESQASLQLPLGRDVNKNNYE